MGKTDLLWGLQDISTHSLSKPLLVLLWTSHGRPVLVPACKATVLDPGLQFFVPGIGTNAINDADDKLFPVLVYRHHQAVVHDILSSKEERIVVDTAS